MIVFLLGALSSTVALAGNPWDKYNLSPNSRTLLPVRIHSTTRSLVPEAAIFPVSLKGSGASVVFDFGKEVGGLTTISLGDVSTGASAMLAWSESTYYIGTGDNSNGGSADGPLATGTLTSGADWVTPLAKLRGGFRYLNVFLKDDSEVIIKNMSLHFTAAPSFPTPSAYANHFFSDDDLVNRVWYGAAYTVQLSSIDPTQCRTWPAPASGWDNSAVCGVGKSVLVDGAKRDRVIWPGDMGVSTATAYYTTGDVESSVNSLETLYKMQQTNGMLPYAGPPVNFYGNSDMYHLWTLVGTINVFRYTGNATWLRMHWDGFKRAVACSCGKISQRGLMSVDKKADWARAGQGGENIAANAVLFHVLQGGLDLAAAMGDSSSEMKWRSTAATVKEAIFIHLWDEVKGAHKDNPSSSVYPQDGNSVAVWFNVTNASQASRISDYLHSNWGPYGSSSPEWGMNIGTFPGSMEVNAHAAAGNTKRALDMVRLQWGYMLNNPNSTESTFWEGYNKDGTFNYQGIYMSNAHGWATGAASMLSNYVLGVRPVTPGGAHYAVAPAPGDLQHCRGRLTLAGGHFIDVAWSRSSSSLTLQVDARKHPGSVGEVAVPVYALGAPSSEEVFIAVDDVVVWSSLEGSVLSTVAQQKLRGSVLVSGMSNDGRYVHFRVHGHVQTNFVVKRSLASLVI